MMKIDRTPYLGHPNVQKLVSANLTWNGQRPFKWTVIIQGENFDIRRKIKPILLEITHSHCAFCDLYPLSSDFFNPSIEHFEPKSTTPQKAYKWENLFPSCNGCTEKKGDFFDENLLKPDESYYFFERFFDVTGDGKLVPSNTADALSKIKSEITINLYKLNERGSLLSERKKYFLDYQRLAPIIDNDERPYRFLIPIAENAKNPDEIINSFIQ